MTQPSGNPRPYPYRARTPDNRDISGSIDAASADDAMRILQSLNFQQIELDAETTTAAPSPSAQSSTRFPLSGEDFFLFNQQLAQLTQAGLPVEEGLRLVAREMRKGAMRRTIDDVAADLQSGKSLPDSVAAHRRQFPPLYSELIDAGIRSGNLSGILFNLGGHLTLIRRLQAMLWQALSYPLVIFFVFIGIFYLIMVELIPRWKPILQGFASLQFFTRTRGGGGWEMNRMQIPWITRGLIHVSDAIAAIPPLAVVFAILLLAVIAFSAWRFATGAGGFAERFWIHMPLIGEVVRRNLLSRWCHAVTLGVEAGLDLPAAIRLADDATASPALRAGGEAMIATLASGEPLSSARAAGFLPAAVASAMDIASQRGDLAVTLRALSRMYQQQAELRIGAIQAILTPLILIIIGGTVGCLMIAMFAPLLAVISEMS